MKILNVVDRVLAQGVVGYSIRTFHVLECQRALGHLPAVAVRSTLPARGPLNGRVYIRDHGSLRSVLGRRLSSLSYRASRRLEGGAFPALIRRAARRERPDLIHCATPHGNFFDALPIARKAGVPILYEVRGFWEDAVVAEGRSSTDSEEYRRAKEGEKAAVRAADAVITVGEALRQEVIRYGARPERVFVARNGVDPNRFRPQEPDPELAARLGLAGHFVVGTACSVRGLEGLDTLLVAVSRLKGLPVKVLVVGDGPERPRLERLARLLGLDGAAVFAGRVPFEQVPSYYALLDVFALPRRRTYLCEIVTPLKPFEAFAMGLPVIASDLPALREVGRPGVTSFLVPPDDAEALAAAIRLLCEMGPDRRSEIGRAARDWVLANGTWSVTAQSYRRAYAWVIRSVGTGERAAARPAGPEEKEGGP